MATFKGFVSALQVRDDGWVEVELLAPHAGNARQTFFVRDLDGVPGEVNRRLSQVGLLRDALARSLPVEVEYRADPQQGQVIEDVQVHPRDSLTGRSVGQRRVGTVIGLAAAEAGPASGASPYIDPPDLAVVTLLGEDGGLLQALLDLQRPDPLAATGMFELLATAHRTRRPVALSLAGAGTPGGNDGPRVAAATRSAGLTWVLAVEFEAVPSADLVEVYAFVERLGQRFESFDAELATALSHVRVRYTTTPGQTPEGDVSDNGSFVPSSGEAWVPGDSPLLGRLQQALRDGLMVRLGLLGDRVHEVVLVARLGSAARPVWIEVRRQLRAPCDDATRCENVPTVQGPGRSSFEDLPLAVSWTGHGYFAEGVWRFVVVADCRVTLTVDCKEPCRDEPGCACAEVGEPPSRRPPHDIGGRDRVSGRQYHAYLHGLHRVELVLDGRACQDPFELRVYRIR